MSAILEFLRKIIRFVLYYGGRLTCNVCKKPLRRFYPFPKNIEEEARLAGFQYDFRKAETLNYDNYSCPFCFSSDRERLYLLFLDNFLKAKNKDQLILDFAPGFAFRKAMKDRFQTNYLTADLLRNDYDLSLDVCKINLESDQFDIVICSHILEHVSDPFQALLEINRILKQGGLSIVMVPLFEGVTSTIEDNYCTSNELRAKYFGQRDHVRLFSKNDFLEMIKKAKFNSQIFTTADFDKQLVKRYAIAQNSFLYVCHKTI